MPTYKCERGEHATCGGDYGERHPEGRGVQTSHDNKQHAGLCDCDCHNNKEFKSFTPPFHNQEYDMPIETILVISDVGNAGRGPGSLYLASNLIIYRPEPSITSGIDPIQAFNKTRKPAGVSLFHNGDMVKVSFHGANHAIVYTADRREVWCRHYTNDGWEPYKSHNPQKPSDATSLLSKRICVTAAVVEAFPTVAAWLAVNVGPFVVAQ